MNKESLTKRPLENGEDKPSARITQSAPPPKPVQYQVMIKTIHGISTHWIYDYQCNYMDLVSVYKDALCSGLVNRALVWDNGIIDMNHIVGITKQ